MVVAALLTFVLDTAQESFDLLLSIGAGTGLLYLLRWFWWRINAWSEIAAMVSSFARRDRRSSSRARCGVDDPVARLAAHHRRHHDGRLGRRDVPHRADRPGDARRRSIAWSRPAGPGWSRVAPEAGVGPSPDCVAAGAARLGARLRRSCMRRCSAPAASCTDGRRRRGVAGGRSWLRVPGWSG